MAHNKTVFERVTRVVNENGEVLSEDVAKFDVLVKDEDEFVFLYKKHMALIYRLNNTEKNVLFWCGTNCMFNTNEIFLSIANKRKMAKEVGLQIGSIDNAITRLVKRNFLTRINTAHYKVTPEFVWCGRSKRREKELSLFIKYKIGDPE